MPYTPPALNAVNFELKAYTAPALNAVNFDYDPVAPTVSVPALASKATVVAGVIGPSPKGG